MGNRVSLAIVSFFLAATGLHSTPVYSVQSLGAGMPTGVNSSGAAVGWLTDSQGNTNPIYFLNGQLGSGGQASAINDAGVAVGTVFTASGPSVVQWSLGQTTSLGISGYGTAINNQGQVAGGYIRPDGQLHAFTWTNETLADLGTLGGSSSSAYGINTSGQVAGSSMMAGGTFHAFFSSNGSLQDLGTLGGANSYGMALNAAGQIVGSAQNAQGYSTAFKWDGQHMVGLGTLGGSQSYGYGINSAGDVVGYSWTADGVTHGFVAIDGVMLDLNSLLPLGADWTIDAAYGINDAGQIIADATRNGQHFAVELNPLLTTPEPSAVVLVLIGLAAIGCKRRSS